LDNDNEKRRKWEDSSMKVGLIGCGRVANLHMLAYTFIKDANIIAVSDANAERVKNFANRHGIKKTFTNHKDLLELKDLDFIDICTPTSTHANLACDVAESAHNILLEKPMALNSSDCDRIISATKKAGVKLCLCHNQKFIPYVAQVKSMVDSGYYDLVSFKTSIKESAELIGAPNWTLTPQEKGVLWETGCHAAYLQLYFLKNIKDVYAVGCKVKHPVYDDLSVLLRTPHRTYGIIEISWLAKQTETIYEVNSADGKRAQILDFNYLLEKSEEAPKHVWSGLYSDGKKVLRKWIKPVIDGFRKGKLLYCLPHFLLISSYMESLKNDSASPVTPEEGKETIKLLECIEESLNKQKIIPMT
jgi:predicted dehydrogenase